MISVIIPIYNSETCLNRCIKSVVSQSYSDLEIILVDDGSKDNSLQLCNSWTKQDKRVKAISHSNKGVSAARNSGLGIASGEYIMFLDSDDTFAPNACEVLLRTISEKKADCVICGTKEPDGNNWTPSKNQDYTSLDDFKHDFVEWLDTELLSPIWNKIYKREKISKLFHSEMSFGEDLCFSLDYLKNCDCISFITDTLHFHDNAKTDSLTHTFNPNRFKDIEQVQAAIMEFDGSGIEKKLFEKYVRDSINYMYSVYSTSTINNSEKKKLLEEWHKVSYLKKLNIADYNMTRKQHLMLSLWKQRRFLWYLWLLQFKRIMGFLSSKKCYNESL